MTDYYKEGFSHVIFPLKQDSDGYPGVGSERLWAKKIAPNQFQIENTPFYVRGVSFQDIVEAKEVSEDVYEFVKVIKHSGHSTFRIFINDEVPERKKVLEDVIKYLNLLGSTVEGFNKESTLTAVDVPPSTDVNIVGQYLHEQYKLGKLDYEEGLVPDGYVSQK